MAERFVIVDGSSYFYRAFYAIPRLTTRKGFPTNAIKGFTNMLKKILRRERPAYAAVVFDAAERTFRHDIYPAYKEQREPMPEELGVQIPWIKRIPGAFGIPTLELHQFEADDIIATLANEAAGRGVSVVVVTQDKDLAQIVTKETAEDDAPGVVIFDDSKETRLGAREVREKYGVPPSKIADLLGLQGDSSDNIPGVKGVGPKTAAQLLERFDSVEQMVERLDQVERPKLRETLREQRETALLSKKLATVVRDLPIRFDPKSFRYREPDQEKLAEIFRELDFEADLRELEGAAAAPEPPRPVAKVERLESAAAVRDFLAAAYGECGIETLAEGDDAMQARLVGIGLAAGSRAAYVPVSSATLEGGAVVSDAVEAMAPALERGDLRWVGHDLKSAIKLLGRPFGGALFDTMLATYLLRPDAASQEMERAAAEFLSRPIPGRAELTGKGKGRLAADQVSIDQAAAWASGRAAAALELRPRLEKELAAANADAVYRDIELPLIQVLADIEREGVGLDTAFLKSLSKDFEARLRTLEKEVFELAGVEFNLDSPKQLSEVLFVRLKLPSVRKTKTGLSTDAAVLEELSARHPLPAKIVEYRSLAKLKQTYVDALPALVNPKTGRVHTSYNQAVAATGRLSSSDPNLQNIPIRTEEGRQIRRAFVAGGGRRLVVADYSQIELRLLAHMSGDETLVQTYREGGDIHARTAAEIFQVSVESVTSDMRRKAKEVNFGIIYGMSAHGLSQRTKIPQAEAKTYIERYFATYKGVRAFLDGLLAEGRKRGYVETMFGRRRPLPDLNSKNGMLRAAAERMAVNAPLQGTAADLIKIAMIRLHARLAREKFRGRITMQVHDELVVDAPEAEVGRVSAITREEMEGVRSLEVPLKVDVSSGINWAEAKGD
jgi:DNA polymerase-1